MEFGQKKNRPLEYPTRLQLYKTPPVQTIALQEFEELALQRLKLLQEIERIRQKCTHEGVHRDDLTYRTKIETAMKVMPLNSVNDKGLTVKHVEERRRDHISHYILRLAYCRTEDMRRWFLSQETELLRCRFLTALNEDRDAFFLHYKDDFNFEHEVVSLPKDIKDQIAEEKKKEYPDCDKLGQQLALSEEVYEFYGSRKKPYSCYKVPFTGALDLVQSRQVVVKKGYIYVPETKDDMIVSLVCNKFRARLSEELVKTLHHLAVVDDDERIAPLLKTIKHRYLGEDFTDAGTQFVGKISLGQLDTLSRESYPPCMRHLHESLRRDHHLRHFGRLQYGLFLKSIGLTLEQALAFWRTEFTKKMEPDKFEKQYAYNVRHSYGKEGKRANYTPYSCMKIILSNAPGQGDSHGCPFRHWDKEHLQRMLTTHGISHSDSDKIMDYVENSHYQLACQKYFDITHGVADSFSLEHPTQFFIESRKVRGGMVGDVKQEEEKEPQGETEFGDLSEHDLVGGFEEEMETS